MFDNSNLEEALVKYKKVFVTTHWKNEKYKWEAVKWFQDHWDINANDFSDMLSKSLSKTFNLLASMNNFPAKMIHIFAIDYPEEVRLMFINLFDERIDVIKRIGEFKEKSVLLMEKHGKGQHYQTENAISTYLWLRYPNKYYIYKFGEVKKVAEELKSELNFKKGSYSDNIQNFYKLYDSICAELKKDQELLTLLKSQLDEDCYHDSELITLTIDVGFFISRKSLEGKEIDYEWFPLDYSPELSSEDWVEVLNNNSIFTIQSLEIMKRMKDFGGQATCKQLSLRYGKPTNFYNRGSSALAQRVADFTGCAVMDRNDDDLKWWPILYIGRETEKDGLGTFEWKLRHELALALDSFDFSDVDLYEDPNPSIWKISHGTESTGISSLNKKKFMERNIVVVHGTTKAKGATSFKQGESFMYSIKKGDYLYLCYGNTIKLLGRFTSDSLIENSELSNQWYERPYEIIKESETDNPYTGVEKWWTPNHNSTCIRVDDYPLFEEVILQPYFDITIDDLIGVPIPQVTYEKYSKEQFLNEVFMVEQRYDILVSVLKNKKNIILQGAPGVGKTFAANRLAYAIMEEKDESRVEFVQFHQNYSYEDFMMGFKPVENGFELKMGVFYRFCQNASNQPDKEFFFIIDEINRGNLSKIFGELLMLIEKDYRGSKITLAYNGLPFTVPKNVYIIGMMNTADRSLAMIDYALRRRFSFFDMEPGFNSEGFKAYQKLMNNETFNDLISKTQDLNIEIMNDRSLGKGFCIGHSYFLGKTFCKEEWMQSIVEFDILPMISEYWFDDVGKLQKWENILRGIFQ